jgi:hypothetical protein
MEVTVGPVIRPGNEPDRAKFSDLNMFVMLGGRERTADDFERLYAEAGFRLTGIVPTGSPTCQHYRRRSGLNCNPPTQITADDRTR